jgi:ubiquinone biosynthesis monooxygenase Coq7
MEAARGESDHLAWCETRLGELAARPSLLNPFWYAGSFAIGALAALWGDRASLGFVAETERQYEGHLDRHLGGLPPSESPAVRYCKPCDRRRSRTAQATRAGVCRCRGRYARSCPHRRRHDGDCLLDLIKPAT